MTEAKDSTHPDDNNREKTVDGKDKYFSDIAKLSHKKRTAKTLQKIGKACRELNAEGTPITIPNVAKRAELDPSTLYREYRYLF